MGDEPTDHHRIIANANVFGLQKVLSYELMHPDCCYLKLLPIIVIKVKNGYIVSIRVMRPLI